MPFTGYLASSVQIQISDASSNYQQLTSFRVEIPIDTIKRLSGKNLIGCIKDGAMPKREF